MVSMLVIETNDIVRAGLAALLRDAGHTIIEARASEELLTIADSSNFDVAIISGEALERATEDFWPTLKLIRPSVRVILLLDGPEQPLVIEADGVILKDATADQLLACIGSVCAGHRWVDPVLLKWFVQGSATRSAYGQLTPRELATAGLIARGLRNKAIAHEMKVSVATVKMHLHHIYEKLQLSGRTELALRARDYSQTIDHRLEGQAAGIDAA